MQCSVRSRGFDNPIDARTRRLLWAQYGLYIHSVPAQTWSMFVLALLAMRLSLHPLLPVWSMRGSWDAWPVEGRPGVAGVALARAAVTALSHGGKELS